MNFVQFILFQLKKLFFLIFRADFDGGVENSRTFDENKSFLDLEVYIRPLSLIRIAGFYIY